MLSDTHWQAIRDALVDREVDRERVLLQLERIAEGYQTLERDRDPNKAKAALIHLQQERKRVSELITWSCGYRVNLSEQLHNFRQRPIAGHDEIEPELCRLIREEESKLASLQTIRRRIFSHIDAINIEVHKFRGKSNPYRENMYIGVLRIWTDIIGGKLTYSRPPKGGPPYGQTIDFLRSCLISILGKAPSASGLANIIDRVRNPEQYAKRKRKPT